MKTAIDYLIEGNRKCAESQIKYSSIFFAKIYTDYCKELFINGISPKSSEEYYDEYYSKENQDRMKRNAIEKIKLSQNK